MEVEVFLLEDAFYALQDGDENNHDQMVLNKIEALPYRTTVVLTQYSMSRSVNDIENKRMLTEPEFGAEAIINLAKNNWREGSHEN